MSQSYTSDLLALGKKLFLSGCLIYCMHRARYDVHTQFQGKEHSGGKVSAKAFSVPCAELT